MAGARFNVGQQVYFAASEDPDSTEGDGELIAIRASSVDPAHMEYDISLNPYGPHDEPETVTVAEGDVVGPYPDEDEQEANG